MAKKTKNTGKIARNRDEIARHFGVNLRTIGTWRNFGMPGKTGAYNLAEIDEWLKRAELGPYRKDKAAGVGEQQKIREEIERAKLRKIQGRLIDVNEVVGIFQAHISEARAILEQLPDQVAAAMPESTAGEDRRRVRDDAARLVRGALMALADAIASPQIAQEA